MARPTDYNPEVLERTKIYLATYKDQGDMIPSIAGLSCYLKIARSTIYDWASQEDKAEFSDILQEILSNQENVLINNGLNKKFSPEITKLVLGKHGYKDQSKSEIEVDSRLSDEEKARIDKILSHKDQ